MKSELDPELLSLSANLFHRVAGGMLVVGWLVVCGWSGGWLYVGGRGGWLYVGGEVVGCMWVVRWLVVCGW